MLITEILRKIYYFQVFQRLKSYGKNVIFSKGGIIKHPEELEIGNNVFISTNFHISARSMTIGDNVIIGPNFTADCDNHIFNKVGNTIYSTRDTRDISPITIENDIWIGCNVTMLKESPSMKEP